MQQTTERAVRGLVEDWAALTVASGFHPERIDGWVTGATGGPVPFTNQGFQTAASADQDAAIASVLAWYQRRELPFVLQVPEHLVEGSDPGLTVAGLVASTQLPLMTTTMVTPDPPAVPDVVITHVRSEQERESFVATAAAGFDVPPQNAGAFATPGVLAHPSFTLMLASIDGEVVGCGQVVVQDGAAGVYSIATLPTARRRGVGRAVTGALLAHAASRGARLAYLQASEMAVSLYESLGFRTVAHHRVYGRP